MWETNPGKPTIYFSAIRLGAIYFSAIYFGVIASTDNPCWWPWQQRLPPRSCTFSRHVFLR